MPRINGGLRACVVQILNPEGKSEGTGFFFHPEGYVLTCWHVVLPWVKNTKDEQITCKIRYRGESINATLLIDLSVPENDLGVLKITPTVSTNSIWKYLDLDVHWDPDEHGRHITLDDALHSFGYPKDLVDDMGISISCKLGGLTPTEYKNFSFLPITGSNISNVEGGYSGAPLVHEKTNRVIGLIYAKDKKTPQSQAFVVYLAPIFKKWSNLGKWGELGKIHDAFEHLRQRIVKDKKVEFGCDDPIPPRLEMKISNNKWQNGFQHKATNTMWAPLQLKDLIQGLILSRQFVLSSNVGAGKTTFLYELALKLLENTSKVPVIVTCKQLDIGEPLKNWFDLKNQLIGNYEDDEFQKTDLEFFFSDARKQSELVFLFDGLDQIQSGQYSEIKNKAFDIAGTCSLLLTSRPSAISSFQSDSEVTFLRLRSFSTQDQQHYYGELYEQAKEVCALAPDLAQVPILAFMVRNLLNSNAIEGSATRTDLYEQFVRHILRKHKSNARLVDNNSIPDIQEAIQELAFDSLANSHIQRVPIDQYKKFNKKVKLDLIEAPGLVNKIRESGKDVLHFTHQSYQEFFAAQYCAGNQDAYDKIYTQRWNPKWKNTIHFLSGLTEKDDYGQEIGHKTLSKLMAEPENVIYANLFLAASCAPEIRKFDSELVNKIRTELFRLAGTYPFKEDAIQALGEFVRRGDKESSNYLIKVLQDSLETFSFSVGSFNYHQDAPFNSVGYFGDFDLAALALGRAGGAERDLAIAFLVERLLKQQHYWEQEKFIDALSSLGDLGQKYVAELFARLTQQDVTAAVKFAVAKVLTTNDHWLDANEKALVDRWLPKTVDTSDLFKDTIANCDNEFFDEVERIKSWRGEMKQKPLEFWIENLDAQVEGMRNVVISQLRSLKNTASLLRYLENRNPNVRCAAEEALGAIGKDLTETERECLLKRTLDSDKEVQIAAIAAFSAIERLDIEKKTGTMTKKWLEDDDRVVREAVVSGLSDRIKDLGEEEKQIVVEYLVARCLDNDAYIRYVAGEALNAHERPFDKMATTSVTKLLPHQDPTMRLMAVKELEMRLDGLSEKVARGVIKLLIAQTLDFDTKIQDAALKTLKGCKRRLDAATISLLLDRKIMFSNPLNVEEVLKSLGEHLSWSALCEISKVLKTRDIVVSLISYHVLSQLYRSGVVLPPLVEPPKGLIAKIKLLFARHGQS